MSVGKPLRGGFLGLLLMVVFAAQPFSFGAPGIEEVVQELNAKGENLEGDACIRHADQYVKLIKDDGIKPADKAYVLRECMRYLGRVFNARRLDQCLPKAREVFALYRGDIVGADPAAEGGMVQSYASFLGFEVARDHAQLAEGLAFIDAHEKFFNADLANPRADLSRAGFLRAAEDREGALEYTEKYLAVAENPDPYAYSIITWACRGSNRPDKLLLSVTATMKQTGNLSDVAVRNAQALAQVWNSGEVDEAKALELLPLFAHEAEATAILLAAAANRKLQTGDMESALAYGRLRYAVAPLDEAPAAMEFVARCLTGLDMSADRADSYWEYQKHGPAGPDGKAGTGDDQKDVLADIGNPLPAEIVSALETRLKAMLPTGPTVYETLRSRGVVCLALGRSRDALRSFKSAYDAASIAQVNEGSALVPRSLKALDGTVVRANAYLSFQQSGPPGPDRKVGTADDLADPLAGEDLPPLDPEVRGALEKIVRKGGQNAAASCQAGSACLALGEYENGLNRFRAAYVMSEPGEAQARAVEGMAAAIKAFDGNVLRANRYLLFQKHGSKGPDGKAGTDDDMENPFPAILREIKGR